jgi:hypothetical protein
MPVKRATAIYQSGLAGGAVTLLMVDLTNNPSEINELKSKDFCEIADSADLCLRKSRREDGCSGAVQMRRWSGPGTAGSIHEADTKPKLNFCCAAPRVIILVPEFPEWF